MPLVNAKCTNCGANLEVDSAKDAAICRYCGSAFIVEKAINNYNVTTHLSANVVNVFGKQSADFVIRAGVLVSYRGAASTVVIPPSVTIIGKDAFADCAGLIDVVLPSGIREIEDQAFISCTRLESINIPNTVVKIGHRAFCGCRALNSIAIPESVKEIGFCAFSGCSRLINLVIATGDTVLLDETALDIPAFFVRGGVLEKFNGVTNTAIIPDSVEVIGQRAFYACSKLTLVDIPHSVTLIEDEAFCSCTGLKSIVIPPSVKSIGRAAFYSCIALEKVTVSSETNYDVSSFENTPWSDYAPSRKRRKCYIATAVYGSYDCPEVRTLRRYRDFRLEKTAAGRAFIKTYYAIAPWCVKHFGKCAWFNAVFRRILDKKVRKLNAEGFSFEPYQDK